jgi:G patch domain-containing protein 1
MSSLSTALEGFSLATTKSTIKKHFEPPAIPRDWRPSKTPTARKSRFEPAAESPAAPTAAKPVGGTNPSRDQRRAVLFPYEANRRSQATAVESKEDAEAKEDQLPDFLTSVQTTSGGPATTAAVAGGGSFRPFANCAEKQKRYEQYLVCLQNNRKDALKLLQPKAMTEWERERERVEFERAAVLYQPMKAVISSRFVSAGSEENGPDKSGTRDTCSYGLALVCICGGLNKHTLYIYTKATCFRTGMYNTYGTLYTNKLELKLF